MIKDIILFFMVLSEDNLFCSEEGTVLLVEIHLLLITNAAV
jgi:hypothetical protein